MSPLSVQLDTLVLQHCASKLHYIDRISQEFVNNRYASALHGTYSTDTIDVRIHCPEVCDINEVDDDELDHLDDDYLNTIEYQISGPKKRQLTRQRDKGSVFGRESLRKVFHAIFLRFTHFRKLKFTGYFGKTATESVLVALNQPNCFPLTLGTIYFKVMEDVLIDSLLIEAFASLVKKLVFVGTAPRLNWTDSLWQSVANCTQLRSLDYRQHTGLIAAERERMKNNLQKCLKILRIQSFRYYLPPMEPFNESFGASWIYESLKGNFVLRNLKICNIGNINERLASYSHFAPLNVVIFADSTLLPIVSRLRDMKVTDEPLCEVENAWKTKPRNIINLLRARNESGAPLTITYLTILNRGDSLELMCASGLMIYSSTDIIERLKFWLQLSNCASTPVKLLFHLRMENDEGEERRARLALASCLTHATDETPGAFIEEQCNQIVLRYQLATVFINVVSEPCIMPYTDKQKVVYHAM